MRASACLSSTRLWRSCSTSQPSTWYATAVSICCRVRHWLTSYAQVGRTSGLVMALTGIFKNILLIAVSVVIWNTKITLLQAVGYSLALVGLIYHWIGGDQLAKGYRAVTRGILSASSGLPLFEARDRKSVV